MIGINILKRTVRGDVKIGDEVSSVNSVLKRSKYKWTLKRENCLVATKWKPILTRNSQILTLGVK